MDWGSVKPLPCESKANGGQIYLEHVGYKFSLLLKVTFVKKKKSGKYPGSLVVRIHSRIALPLFWPGFNPWLGNRDFEIHMVWSKFFFNF